MPFAPGNSTDEHTRNRRNEKLLGILNYYTEEEHLGPQPSFETFVDFAMTGCLECRSIGIQGSLRCSQFAAHFKAPVLAVKRLLTWQ